MCVPFLSFGVVQLWSRWFRLVSNTGPVFWSSCALFSPYLCKGLWKCPQQIFDRWYRETCHDWQKSCKANKQQRACWFAKRRNPWWVEMRHVLPIFEAEPLKGRKGSNYKPLTCFGSVVVNGFLAIAWKLSYWDRDPYLPLFCVFGLKSLNSISMDLGQLKVHTNEVQST